MPKISELPTDVAPDVLDTVPFVDVSAARTEQVTVGDLAASAAFSGRYQQLAGDEIWLPAGSFSVILGSPVPGVGAPFVDAYLMDASGDEIVASSVFLPAWWATFAVDLYWYNAGAGAGAVTWGLYRSQPDEANTINGIGSISGFVVQTARAQNVLDVFTIGSGISNTGGMFTFGVDRYGVDAADTLANDAAFCGLHLRRLT